MLIGFCEEDYARLREKMHIPFVIYEGFFSKNERVSNLLIDNFDGGRQVGAYLRAMGHTRVLCIADNDICMDAERMAGCRAEMPPGAVDFLCVPMERAGRLRCYEEQLERMRGYTAVFAASDVYAIELLYFLQGHGIRVPGDISVVGFDNIGQSAQVFPGLTTVGQDVGERARLALAELARLKEDPAGGREILLPVQLVIRESVRRIEK